ncbi:unnamed protein product [Durusdinium trenchii]|uniref:C2H2-type domain-containing protein n=2 Tax=Durusdinium trenchii TaxID=1381693 RepID=A0ABP0KDL2_9DINO
MGLKSQRQKEARKELKRTLRASELCPHCRKKVTDLEEHLKSQHSISCVKCGQHFRDQQSWKHHMRDLHGLAETEAAKADRHAKLQKWTRERSKKSKGKSKDSQIEVTPPGLYRHSCDLCGAEVDLAVNLAGQGLTFKCAIMGRACSGPKSAPVMAPAVPVTPVASAPGAGAVMAVDVPVPDDDDL